MAPRGWIRFVIIAVVILVALLALRLHVAQGQVSGRDEAGDALSGRRLAEAWCTECHSVEQATSGKGKIAPDFTAIAQRQSTTALSLAAFLQTTHKTMPNFIIERRHADDIIAYILSLRRE
jgi:cytochrome c